MKLTQDQKERIKTEVYSALRDGQHYGEEKGKEKFCLHYTNKIIAIVEEESECEHEFPHDMHYAKCKKCGVQWSSIPENLGFSKIGGIWYQQPDKPRRIGLLPEVFAGLHPDVAMLWKAVRELQKDRNERLGV